MPDSLATLELTLNASGAASATDNLDAKFAKLGGTADRLTASQEQLQTRINTLAASVTTADIANAKAIETLQRRIATEQQLAAIIQAQPAQFAQLTALTNELTGAQGSSVAAVAEVAAGHERAAAAVAGHSFQTGRLRQDLGTLLGRLTGTMPILDRFAGQLGAMAIGNVMIIGVMGGIAAIAYAYEKLSLSLKGVTADQEKAIEAFEKAEKLKMAGGATGVANTGLTNNIAAYQGEVARLQQQIDAMGSVNTTSGGASTNAAILVGGLDQTVIDSRKKRLDELVALQADAQAKLNAEMAKADLQNQEHYATQLATIVKGNTAKRAQLDQALALEKTYFAAAKLEGDQGNLELQAEYTKLAEGLKAAFTKADAAPGVHDGRAADQQFAADAATKEAELTNALTDRAAAMHLENDALKQGEATRETYLIQLRYAEEVTKSLTDSTDAAAAAHVKAAAAVRDEELARVAITQAEKDATGTQALLDKADALKRENDALKQGEDTRATYLINEKYDLEFKQALLIADDDAFDKRVQAINLLRQEELAHVAITQAQKDGAAVGKVAADETQRAWATAFKDIQRTVSTMFDDFFTKGVNAFQATWDAMKTGFFKTISDIMAAGVMSQLGDKLKNTVLAALSSNPSTSGLPNGIGAPSPVAGVLSAAIPYVAGLALIATSIMTTATQNAQAQAVFRDANVKWQASFQTLVDSFAQTNFDKAKSALDAQFQSLADSAIQAAATAIAGSKATWNINSSNLIGGANRDAAPTVGALGSMSGLEAYIASLQGAQGSGKNVAQDRDLATLLSQLQQLDAEYKIQAKAAEDARVAAQAAFVQDLHVKELRNAGMTDEADALALFNQQAKDFKDAVTQGYDATTLAELGQEQATERAILAANQAAAAQQKLADATASATAAIAKNEADAATLWTKIASDFQTFTQNMADATTSLSVRLMKATGDAAGAAALAFKLQQSQEMNTSQAALGQLQLQQSQAAAALAAQNASGTGKTLSMVSNGSGGYGYVVQDPLADAMKGQIASIQQEIQAQLDYMKQLGVVQAAEAIAQANGTGATSMPGATAGVPGTAGTFGTVVSVTTAQQADLMLDELTTTRVLAQAYWPYLKVIADKLSGGVNSILGSALQGSLALAGGSTVS